MLSTLEIRHLVEQSFLPTRCECTVDPGTVLTVRFFHAHMQTRLWNWSATHSEPIWCATWDFVEINYIESDKTESYIHKKPRPVT
ncbi:DUF1652 domain-containing protein [Pseudomonas sp. NPDC098740]|uniref:DUF1652 domain-containing protein n=1 Tax=Pseudomonas sp. NPDC098740 TaxID=3364486 RepID=UPI00383AED62